MWETPWSSIPTICTSNTVQIPEQQSSRPSHCSALRLSVTVCQPIAVRRTGALRCPLVRRTAIGCHRVFTISSLLQWIASTLGPATCGLLRVASCQRTLTTLSCPGVAETCRGGLSLEMPQCTEMGRESGFSKILIVFDSVELWKVKGDWLCVRRRYTAEVRKHIYC